jgi:hypothetical protein
MTFATGYTYEVYERFVGSLFDTGFSGDIHFFINDGDEKNLKKLQGNFNKIHYEIPLILPEYGRKPATRRHFIYLNYLNNNKTNNDYAFLSDMKDVIFQRNIEKYPYDKGTDLYVFEEDCNIASCKFNRRWLKRKDAKFFNKIKENKIICAGTTLGTLRGITKYLEIMTRNIQSDEIAKRGLIYRDQCLHNYMIYNNELSELKVKALSNENSLVYTMKHAHKEVNEKNEIVNKQGKVPYVCHQYQYMSPEQLKQISTKYTYF